MKKLCSILFAALIPLLTPSLATSHGYAPLLQLVRQATAKYRYVQNALDAGYEPGACVSGRDEGAMGIHFVKGALLGDGMVNAATPEALIYEPMPHGGLRLVGVEYITFVADWDRENPPPPMGGPVPATLEGHLFHYSGSPNRYGIPPFYELHVWAWKHNPNGTFSDWNPNVSCHGQPLTSS